MMRWAEAEDIFVPKIGLADGLIHHLYDQLVAQKFDSRL
jgi:exopolyphosphatase/guanosine-5'-triphosphate,3'-diphosphate pyrophosphatase